MNRDVAPSAIALLALMKIKGIGRKGALKLVKESDCKEANGALRERVTENVERANIAVTEFESAWGKAETDIERSLDADIDIISIYEANYPTALRKIPDPPAVLFVKGDAATLGKHPSVAVIGTREPTSYGEEVAVRSAQSAVEKGFVIISGLALGCDTQAHEGCLEANGRGIAVMAHGLDRVYPAPSRSLAKRLLEAHGCLVSEYVIGTAPFRTHFAERDRIQSGLSDGVLVIETGESGGTMHTVRFAREQKREIACIDHPLKWRQSEKTLGNQKLIRDHWAAAIRDKTALFEFLDRISTTSGHETKPAVRPDMPQQSPQHSWAF